MGYEVIKTVKGRQYRYSQRSYRVPGRRTPKTESRYIGPVEAVTGIPRIDWKATLRPSKARGIPDEALQMKQIAEDFREEQEQQRAAKTYEALGVKAGSKNPTPTDKPAPTMHDHIIAAPAAPVTSTEPCQSDAPTAGVAPAGAAST